MLVLIFIIIFFFLIVFEGLFNSLLFMFRDVIFISGFLWYFFIVVIGLGSRV